MADDLQHCPDCREEYIAGVTACVECGGALRPGPLERSATRVQRAGGSAGGAAEQAHRLLVELPGLQADLATRALLLEGIAVRVECQGASKLYAAGDKPTEPFAVTLPVSVYVAAAQLDTAQEILASLQQDDVIGSQWSDRQPGRDSEAVGDQEWEGESADSAADMEDDSQAIAAPKAESTSMRAVLILVAAAILLLFLFGR
jgi:hypothetical protein